MNDRSTEFPLHGTRDAGYVRLRVVETLGE
jgi:hypothetical protein